MKAQRFRMGQNRGLPLHLDTGPEDFQYQFPLEGEVSAVYTKDNAQNLTGGKYTTYQVKAFFPNTYTAVLNSQVRYMGQGGNGDNAQEDPLLVGQRVVIAFLGGHPDRPFIMGTLPDSLTDNVVSQTEAQHPRYKKITNGLDVEVDKDGKASVKLVSGQQVEIQDSSGAVVAVIKEDGTIQLGGTTGLDNLLQKSFGSTLSTAFTAAAATLLIPEPAVSAVFTTLATNTTANTNTNSTSQTEAK